MDEQEAAHLEVRDSRSSRAVRRAIQAGWLAILLGFAVQILVASSRWLAGGPVPGMQFVADAAQGVSWATLVCAGVAIGTVAMRARATIMGALGLVSGPFAWATAKGIQRGVQSLVGLAPDKITDFFYLVSALKGIEYGILGVALGKLASRERLTMRSHLISGAAVGAAGAVGFVSLNYAQAMKTGAAFPLSRLVGLAVNEFVFPIGCALVIYMVQRFRTHARLGDLPQR